MNTPVRKDSGSDKILIVCFGTKHRLFHIDKAAIVKNWYNRIQNLAMHTN